MYSLKTREIRIWRVHNMKIEPLREEINKLKKEIEEKKGYKRGFNEGVDASLKLFNRYVDFYDRYFDDINLLLKEEKKTWEKWISYYEKQKNINKDNLLKIYNKWLFNYFFDFSPIDELFL